MSASSWFKKKLDSIKDEFDFRLERLILDITEKISKRLKQKGMNRVMLAEVLNVSPPAVTKILNGTSNFTLKTLLSLADALDFSLKVDFVEKPAENSQYIPKEKVVFESASDDEFEFVFEVDPEIAPSKAHSSGYAEKFDLAA